MPNETTAGANEGTSDLADSAKQAASQAIETVRDQATSRVDEQRNTLASGLQSVAEAFRHMGQHLQQDSGPVAQYASQIGQTVGGGLQQAAGYLRNRDARQLIGDAEIYTRRSPAVVLGGLFLLGFAASRFLKSAQRVPDLYANMPDPNRALPPAPVGATTWPASQPPVATHETTTPPTWNPNRANPSGDL